MQSRAKKLELDFDNSMDELIPSLQMMLQYIGSCVPVGADSILFRSKAILTELLTNAIKHAGVSSTCFDIEAGEEKVIIIKTDQGPPLKLAGICDKVSASGAADNILISADPLNSLYANKMADNSICFTCEENIIDDLFDVDDMMEHFGMLIISKSANGFTYTYDKETRSNIFKAELLFDIAP